MDTRKILKWFEKPTQIKYWKSDINYVMFVDENGNSDITSTLKTISQRKEIDLNDKYFTITGCIFKKSDYLEAKSKIEALKNKYWPNGYYTYNGISKKVCFHSREIRKKIDSFDSNRIDYDSFIEDLTNLISELNYKIISVSIDKENYLLKNYKFNTYNTAMCFLLQRFIYAMPSNAKGIIMLEARGKKEDKILLDEMKHIIFETGIKGISTSEFQMKINGIYFNPKWTKQYDNTFCGLEIADLSSYPIHKFIRNGNRDKAFIIIESKIDKYPNYNNKGIKLFP